MVCSSVLADQNSKTFFFGEATSPCCKHAANATEAARAVQRQVLKCYISLHVPGSHSNMGHHDNAFHLPTGEKNPRMFDTYSKHISTKKLTLAGSQLATNLNFICKSL